MIIIGIHGKARSGKTTSGEYLTSKGCYVNSLAARVYKTVQVMFNLQDYELDDKYKTIKHPKWGLTLREMLVLVGHDMARKLYDENIWMRHIAYEISEAEQAGAGVFVITDIRYADENTWLYNQGGILVHLQRDVDYRFDHITERGLSISPHDYVIKNSDSIQGLYDQWDIVLEKIRRSK